MKKESFIRRQSRRLTEGEINRRRFVMSVLATGVTLPTALSLASRAEAQTPRKGGILRYGTGFGADALCLAPRGAGSSATAALTLSHANCLTEMARNGRPVPELAEGYESQNASRTWVFWLRRDVQFHDGKTLTADDVVATMRHRMRLEETLGRKGLLENVAAIHPDGAFRVIFDLRMPEPEFPLRVSDHRLAIRASADGALADNALRNGTGAYAIGSNGPDGRFILSRNPSYFKSGSAHFDEVHLVPIGDAAVRQNALMNGEVEFIDNVDPQTVALLGRVQTLTLLETPGLRHYGASYRQGTGARLNPELAMALKLAIDRHELVDKILLGHGQVGNDVPLREDMLDAHARLPVHQYDPGRAAAFYRRSGHAGPVSLIVPEDAFPGAQDTACLIARSAHMAGIDVRILAGSDTVSGWHLARRDSSAVLGRMPFPGQSEGTGWDCPGLEEMVTAARSESDPSRRSEICAQARQRQQSEGGSIVAMWANDIHAHATSLCHAPEVGADLHADGARIAERWWYA